MKKYLYFIIYVLAGGTLIQLANKGLSMYIDSYLFRIIIVTIVFVIAFLSYFRFCCNFEEYRYKSLYEQIVRDEFRNKVATKEECYKALTTLAFYLRDKHFNECYYHWRVLEEVVNDYFKGN